jgi:hypothetical protein
MRFYTFARLAKSCSDHSAAENIDARIPVRLPAAAAYLQMRSQEACITSKGFTGFRDQYLDERARGDLLSFLHLAFSAGFADTNTKSSRHMGPPSPDLLEPSARRKVRRLSAVSAHETDWAD